MIERLCGECDKPVTGKLFKGMCRTCYDNQRVTSTVAIPERMKEDFSKFMGEREDTAKGIIELVEIGLIAWKHGKWVRIVEKTEL